MKTYNEKIKSWCAYTTGGGFWGIINAKNRKEALEEAIKNGCVDVRLIR